MTSGAVEFVDESNIRAAVRAVFEDLRLQLAALLPDAAIEHIGATAVPGAVTKGDLDVCVLVDQGGFAEADRLLAERFARNVGSDHTESLSSFSDGSKAVPVGIQLVARGGPEDFFVRWRDLLRDSPRVLEAYNALKRQWHGRSHESYRIEKSKLIERALRAHPNTPEDSS
ncbi:MAG TPA: GrpB family protein [Polyangia bacterium]